MKRLLTFSLLFSVLAYLAFGALTDADLDKIRLIVNASELFFVPSGCFLR